ncbi:MAG: M4 family metallopeptidase [Sedimentisphaerales bacterium]|nr:M4 family metallopeptidase [Sedimentisphaerales bacterium]
MNRRTHLKLAGALLVWLLGTPGLLLAQNYTIDWWTVDRGGGLIIPGGGYELSATIGQPDAVASLSAGGYELTGGFWPVAETPLGPPDCNGNGVADTLDIAGGTSEDLNHNGVPDECEEPELFVEIRLAQAIDQLQQAAGVAITPDKLMFTAGPRPIPHFLGVKVPVPSQLPQDPVVRGLDFLIRHRKLYDLVEPRAQLFLKRVEWVSTSTQPESPSLRFGQHQNGIPVFGAELVLHLSADQGHILGTTGYYIPNIPKLPPAKLSIPEAEAIAQADLGESGSMVVGDTNLVYYNEGLFSDVSAPTYLAYRIMLVGAGAPWRYVVEAHDGTILATQEEIRTGKDFDLYNARGDSSNSCFDWSFGLDDTVFWYDETGPSDDYPDCGANACPPDCQPDTPHCSELGCSNDGVIDGDLMYCFAHDTYDYFRDTFSWRSFDDDDEEVEAYVNWGAGCPNSYAYESECLAFCPSQVTRDIFGHEFTHLVQYNTSNLAYKNESGALNESFADFFGTMVEFWVEGAGGDWLIGEDRAGGAFRDMCDPPAYADPDHWTGRAAFCGDRCNRGNDWGGVHDNNGIPNKAACLISEGGSHNGFVIDPPLGRAKAEPLLFHVMRHLPESAHFSDAAAEAVSTAESWRDGGRYGFTDEDVCAVRNAYAAVGVYEFPDTDCDGVVETVGEDDDGDGFTNDIDLCPGLRNYDNSDPDGDGQANLCDDDDDGDGRPDGDDNCPLSPNGPDRGRCAAGADEGDVCTSDADCDGSFCLDWQADRDHDGVGDVCDDSDDDGVSDQWDNCWETPNSDQTNTDGGSFGDACDTDDDGDSVLDNADNCPLEPNPDQADDDEDDVGDSCDNCAGRDGCDAAVNPSQANSDCQRERRGGICDACGDECDDDRDGDGVNNGDDNCPDLANSDQLRLGLSGKGLACDDALIHALESLPIDGLPFQGFVSLAARQLVRVPIFPCVADGCPDYMSATFRTHVAITVSPVFASIRVADDTGATVAKVRKGVTDANVDFRVAGDYYSNLAALAGLPPVETGLRRALADEVTIEPYRGRKYYLELWPSAAMQPGQQYPITLSVHNTLAPGDFDLDGDVDPDDLGAFEACSTGPGIPFSPGCIPKDLDYDNDVDQTDFAAFQRCLSGPDVPADPSCAD